MRVLVTGATGYVGGRLVGELLGAGHDVVVLARSPAKLEDRPWTDRVEVVVGDAFDGEAVTRAMKGVAAAYYLLHSMDGDSDFSDREARMARVFAESASHGDVGRIVYLGGLVAPGARPSEHLASRSRVGEVLASGPVPVTELRAAVIIGSGSASFEMVRNLVDVLPVMVTPRWVRNRCQPIAIRDVLAYLVGVLDNPATAGRVLEIGGPDVLTYGQLMQQYAEVAGLRRRLFVPVPVVTPRLSSHWVGLVTPIPVGLAKPLVHSLANDTVVTDDSIRSLVPRDLVPFRQAVHLALRRIQDLDVPTTWAGAGGSATGASSALPQPTDPAWSGGRVYVDHREATSSEAPAAVWARVEGIGGDRGYYAFNLLWAIRGLLDKLVGGIGLRRGRRHPDRLAVGEALDFWRVEQVVRPDVDGRGRLLLRAEMRLPGVAWLDLGVEPADGGGTRLVQRARYHPRGVWGRLYWATVWPFHKVVFPAMVRGIAAGTGARPVRRGRASARRAAGR